MNYTFSGSFNQSFFNTNIIHGKGGIVSELRNIDLPNHLHVRSSGAVDITINASEAWSVEVLAQENILPLIHTELRNDELVIRTEPVAISCSTIKVIINHPTVKSIVMEGSGDLSAQVATSAVAIASAGSGDVSINGVVDNMTITSKGSGDITVRGRIDNLEVVTKGSGDFNAINATVTKADIVSNGSGDVIISKSSNANVVSRGSGEVIRK